MTKTGKTFWNNLLITMFAMEMALVVMGQDVNMSRFDYLLERDTCKEPKMLQIRSPIVWDNNFELFYQGVDTTDYYHRRFSEPTPADQKPIYHVNFDQSKLLWTYDKKTTIFTNYIAKYETLFFYPLDWTTNLFIFKIAEDTSTILIFNYKNWGKQKIGIVSKGNIRSGSIPLLLYKEEVDGHLRNLELPYIVNVINNEDYSYRSGLLKIVPEPSFVEEHVLYYGFNQNMTRIYFASSLQLLKENVEEYLPATNVVNGKWHPFRCYDYIYLYLKDWILIFPHFNLTETLDTATTTNTTNSKMYYAEMTIMHRNSLFRCTSESTTVPIPIYPSTEICIQEIPNSEINWLAISLVFMFLVILIVSFIIIYRVLDKRRKHRQSKSNQNLDYKSGETSKNKNGTDGASSSAIVSGISASGVEPDGVSSSVGGCRTHSKPPPPPPPPLQSRAPRAIKTGHRTPNNHHHNNNNTRHNARPAYSYASTT